MVINLDDKSITEIFLSIVSIGLLKCIEEGLISYDDANDLLYQPFNLDKVEELYPERGQAIHLGTELEGISKIVPNSINSSISEIYNLNKDLIKKNIKPFRNNENGVVRYSID